MRTHSHRTVERGNSMVEAFLAQSLKLQGMTLKHEEYRRILKYIDNKGEGNCEIYSLFPGITLVYVKTHSYSWPVPKMSAASEQHRALAVHCCIKGRCKITGNRSTPTYINNGEIAIMRQFFGNEYSYPKGVYEGLDILIDMETCVPHSSYLEEDFGLDLNRLAEDYCPGNRCYSAPCVAEMKRLLKIMWGLPENDPPYCIFQMKMYVMAMLGFLLHAHHTPAARQGSFLTEGQIAIAQESERIITQDLSRRCTARELAERFSVSESSLKNYFRSVFGKNFSTYVNEARMQRGALLLTTTDLPVSDIAGQVSYARQSKFTEAFKKQYGVTPLEYRRLNRVREEYI